VALRNGSRLRRLLMTGLAAAVTVACAGPTHSRGDYELKLANTAEALESSAQTVVMAAGLIEDDRAFQPYTAAVISQAEDDATSVQQTFGSRQPPDEASDRLRQRAEKTIDDVVSAITDARVAIRGSDLADLQTAARQIQDLLPDLQDLEEV
jgi:hypothetical protein